MNHIRSLRESINMTQERLARNVNVERSTVAKWETGKSLPRAEKLFEVARALGVTVDDLLKPTNITS